MTYRYGRGVDIEFVEDCESFLEKLALNRDVCDIRGVVVVQLHNVIHNP